MCKQSFAIPQRKRCIHLVLPPPLSKSLYSFTNDSLCVFHSLKIIIPKSIVICLKKGHLQKMSLPHKYPLLPSLVVVRKSSICPLSHLLFPRYPILSGMGQK